MKEELKKDLKKSYDLAKVMAAAKWLSEEMEDNVEDKYDYALLTISMFEAGEDESKAEPVLQIRVRKDGVEKDEEFAVVSSTVGFTNTTDDLDKKIDDLGGIIETVTEELLLKFPDDVLTYRWLEDKG